MAESVGIAGTAAGLVSLGLQVYSGISTYLDSYKGREDDLRSAAAQLTSLRQSLETIKKAEPRLTSHNYETTTLTFSISSCENELKKLDHQFQKFRTSSPTMISERIKKLTFPLHRSSLIKLEGQLSETNNVLQTALLALGLSSSLVVEEKIDGISADVLALKSELGIVGTQVNSTIAAVHSGTAAMPETVSRLGSIEQGVNRLISRDDTIQMVEATAENTRIIQNLDSGVQELVTKTDQNLIRVQSGIATYELMQDNMAVCLDKLSTIQEALGIGTQQPEADNLVALHRLLAKPDYTKRICDDVSKIRECYNAQPDSNNTNNKNLESNAPLKGCYCQRQIHQTTHYKFGSFWLKQGNVVRGHRSGCKYAIPGITDKTRSLALVTKLVSLGVQFTVSITTGAGGLSISPNINFWTVVDQHKSPVFQTLSLLSLFGLQDRTSGLDLCQFAKLCKMMIIRMYQEKKSSPYEITESGESFFHHWADIVKTAYHSRRDTTIFDRYTREFLEVGLPANIYDFDGVSPALALIRTQSARTVHQIVQLIESTTFKALHDKAPETSYLTRRIPFVRFSFGPSYVTATTAETCAGILGFDKLSTAILTGNLPAVRVLVRDRVALFERGAYGQTPLHLAVIRPDILDIVISSGSEIFRAVDIKGRHSIDYALEFGAKQCRNGDNWTTCSSCPCTHSLELLLSVDDCFDAWLTQRNPFNILLRSSHACRTRLLDELYSRRDQLTYLARKLLTGVEIERFNLSGTGVLDFHAGEVLQCLTDTGYEIPTYLQVGVNDRDAPTVYHKVAKIGKIDDAHRLATMFFERGFRDVDVANHHGFTPLLTLAVSPSAYIGIDLALWLLDHSADFMKNVSIASIGILQRRFNHEIYPKLIPSWTAAHFLLGHYMFAWRTATSITYNSSLASLIMRVGPTQQSDICRCYCTFRGCTPASFAFLQLSRKLHPIGFLAAFLERHSVDYTSHHGVCLSSLRILTFEILGLRHTCCQGGETPFWRSPDEIEEAFDEQRETIELLERLMREFEEKLDYLSLKFTEFLTSYWGPRMQEVLAELEAVKLTEEEIRAAENIGVTWHNESPSVETDEVEEVDQLPWGTMEYWIKELNKIAEQHGIEPV